MRRRQKNIYSLLDRIGMELTDEAQSKGMNPNGGRQSPTERKEEATEGIAPEGVKKIEPEVQLENKLDSSGSLTPTDFINREVCPRCENTELVRVQRNRWMRLFPGSEHYRCLECEARFLWVGRLEIKLSKGEN
jgi:predicted RNA-binding Zn-ribbon protein involved in translation (DUF1610 family)